MKAIVTTSLIVTTYNRPSALALVLRALAKQDISDFEVIVADDGSDTTTQQLIATLQPELPYPLKHIWQSDEGFQAAKIRNKAVAKAAGNYLIFLDGDCVPFYSFIRKHRQLAEKNWLVMGNRVLLNQSTTEQVLTFLSGKVPVYEWSYITWFRVWLSSGCNRFLPLLPIPWLWRKKSATSWRGVKTCNLGMWKEDFLKVNGFDESYVGWGYEDSDLTIRLMRQGVRRKQGRFAVPVIHLWHPESDRSQEAENLARLFSLQQTPEASPDIS